MIRQSGITFSQLFKKYRLKSEIESLSEFGDLLAEEGFVYESSLFTHWQKGDRIPKDRRLLLKIIEIFAKRGGISSIDEANQILESADQRDVTDSELIHLQEYFPMPNTTSLPDKITTFIGRERLIKEVVWELVRKKKVLLYGVPGVGKTALAIEVGYLLRDQFKNGVFWFRADLKSLDTIADELLNFFGIETQFYSNTDEKIKKIQNLAINKNFLIILDNLNQKFSNSTELMKLVMDPNVTLLTTSISDVADVENTKKTKVPCFTEEEFLKLAYGLLGQAFVISNINDIQKIGKLLGYLPITSTMILKQIFLYPLQLKDYLSQIGKKNLDISQLTYDNKSLYSSFDIMFRKLDAELKNLLVSSSVFDGSDFSINAIAYINNIPEVKAGKKIHVLHTLSLVDFSIKGRYRIHPALKLYLKEKVENNALYERLIQFYFDKLHERHKYTDEYMLFLNSEFENIAGLMKFCIRTKRYKNLTRLWSHINLFAFNRGKWLFIYELDKDLQRAFKKNQDHFGLAFYYIEDISKIYYFQSKIKKAESLTTKGYTLAKKIKDKELIARSKQKFGLLYMFKGSFVEAEISFLDSIDYFKKHKIAEELFRSYVYLGNLCRILKKYDRAIYYINFAYKKSLKNREVLYMATIILAKIYLEINKLRLAEKVFVEAQDIAKKSQQKIAIALSGIGLSKLRQAQGQIKDARVLFDDAKKIFIDLQINLRNRTIWSDLMNSN